MDSGLHARQCVQHDSGIPCETRLGDNLVGKRSAQAVTLVVRVEEPSEATAIAMLLGSQTLIWLSSVQSKVAAIVLTGVVLAIAVLAFKRIRGLPVWARRCLHWEFWPAWVF